MVPRKFRESDFVSREAGRFGNKQFRTTPVYIYIYIEIGNLPGLPKSAEAHSSWVLMKWDEYF